MRLSDAEIRRKYTQKNSKNIAEGYQKKSSHNGVTHYVFLVLYQKRLNGH